MTEPPDPWLDYFDAVVDLAETKVKRAKHAAVTLEKASGLGDAPEAAYESAMWDLEMAEAELVKAAALRAVAEDIPDRVMIGA